MENHFKDVFHGILLLVQGVALGMVFYGGLWYTLRKVLSSKHPGLLFFGSYLLRLFLVMAAFFFLSEGNWRNMLGLALGFFAAKVLSVPLVRWWEKSERRESYEA